MTPPKRRRSNQVDLEAFMQSSARWSLIYGLLCVPTLGATAGAAIDNAQKAARNARFLKRPIPASARWGLRLGRVLGLPIAILGYLSPMRRGIQLTREAADPRS